MELTDIMALVKAGYTKEEIALMEKPSTPAPAPDPEPVKETTQTPQPAPVVEPPAQPVPAPQPAQPEAQPTMAELMQSILRTNIPLKSQGSVSSFPWIEK